MWGQTCPPASGVALQVLGSGGPIADDARASSAYLVWHDGRARVLVDIGGGAVLRYAESGAQFTDLDAVLLSHLHADHSADLPALLKSGYFSHRERPLVLAGPAAGGNARVSFPGMDDFVEALLNAERGAYAYLDGYLDGSDGMPELRVHTLDSRVGSAASGEVELAIQALDGIDRELTITAVAVPHGPVPALAWRVEVAGRSLVFAGDQNGMRGDLVRLAQGADLLVLHMPIGQKAGSAARALHAGPMVLGKTAARAQVGQLVLSHFMARSLSALADNVAAVAASYEGPITVADDLACLPLH